MATRDPIDDTELMTRLGESREDVFEDLQDDDSRLGGDQGIAFQEFSRRVSEKREGRAGYGDDEGASIAVLNEIDSTGDVTLRRRDQRTVETTSRDLFSARKYQEDERSAEAIARDRATNAETVTGDYEKWKKNPGQVDFPGVDTRGNIGPQLTGAEQSSQTAAETPGQREANIAADNTDSVLLGSQAAAGVDDDDLNREVLFGAQAEAEDVSLSPAEGVEGRYSGSDGNFAGGPAYNTEVGGVVETDRVDQERRPPEQALQEQQDSMGGGVVGELVQGGSNFGQSIDSDDRKVIRQVERSSAATGERPQQIQELRFDDNPSENARDAFVETVDTLLGGRDAIEDPQRTDVGFFEDETLERAKTLRNRLGGGR